MLSWIIFFTLLCFPLFCTSCGSGSASASSSGALAPEGANIKSIYDSGYDKGYKMVMDEETGFSRAVSTKNGSTPFSQQASPYDSQSSTMNKQFSTAEYNSKRWDQTQKKSILPWKRTKEEFHHAPQFIKDNADITDRNSQTLHKTYATGKYPTAAANEAAYSNLEKPPNYIAKKRREVYAPPKVTSQTSYNKGRSGRSVQDVKSLLSD